MKSLIQFFVGQKLFANLITAFIMVIGVLSVLQIRREVFPNVTFEVITVQTIYPGASPIDVEKTVTSPLEEELREVEGIKKMMSVSASGRSYIVLQLDSDQTTENEAKSDVQDVIDRFEDLPVDAEEPLVQVLESKLEPIVEVTVSGELPDIELRTIARQIEREIEEIPGVAKVTPRGMWDREIRVEVDPKKLKQYRVGIMEVVQALESENVSIPGGVLEGDSDSQEKIIRTFGDFGTLDDVLDTVVRANDFGKSVRVRDLATARLGLEKPTILNRANGSPSVSLTVIKKQNSDAVTVVDRVKEYVEQKKLEPNLPVQLGYMNDLSIFIRNRLEVLSGNLWVGMFLVVLLLSLILSFRMSLLVSMSIPICFLATISVFYFMGVTLHVVSLIGLIIVCGMLVDNAVVVTDACESFMRQGMSADEAAVEGTYQVVRSIFASTMTTVIAFLPMLFMSGIFGKFVFFIPLGVITALLFSLIVSFFILPPQFAILMRKKGRTTNGKTNFFRSIAQKTSRFWDEKLNPLYLFILRKLVPARYLAVTALFLGIIAIVWISAVKMKFILFPPDGVEIFFVKTEAPVGVSLQQHLEMIHSIEREIQKIPSEELMGFVTTVGQQSEGNSDPQTKRGNEYAMMVIYLHPETKRERTADQIIEEFKSRVGEIPALEQLTIERARSGPQVGKPISLGVRGETFEEIMPVVKALKEFLKNVPGVQEISDSYMPGQEEIRVIVDRAEAAAAGLSVATVGRSVLAAYDGIVATSIRDLDEETDVRVQFPFSARQSLENLRALQILNSKGQLIPLSSIAKFEKTTSLASIEHEAAKRQVKVTAEVDTNITDASRANNAVREYLPELKSQFPKISVNFGGEDEDTQESLKSLFRAFAVAIMGILLVLILTFGTFSQPFLVLFTIPIGIAAVLLAFWVHALPLTFMGMLGIIALGGVIVNNAIIFVDFVNQRRAAGDDRWESLFAAAKMRIRPIFLTTLTTVLGVLPTAYGIGGMDRFVVPIAVAVGWGLLFGSFMTALFFPLFQAILDDLLAFGGRLKGRLQLKS